MSEPEEGGHQGPASEAVEQQQSPETMDAAPPAYPSEELVQAPSEDQPEHVEPTAPEQEMTPITSVPDDQPEEPTEQTTEEPKPEVEKPSSSSSSSSSAHEPDQDEAERKQREIEKFSAREQKRQEIEEAKKAREREELKEKEKIEKMNREKMEGIDTGGNGKKKSKGKDKEPLVVFQGGSKGDGFPEVKFEESRPAFDPDSDVTFGETLVDMTEPGAVKEEREQYDNMFQYLLACIGFAVGLGNVWRFPRVALENGGGAFVIPWIVVIIIQGIPLVLVELLVGQRFRGGPMHSYGRMNKFCWGIGASMGFCSLYISLFYNSLLSYAFIYFFNSFTKDLPWLGCSGDNANNTECVKNPAQFYFTYSVVNPAPDLDSGSGIVWPLYFATAIAWGVVFLAMFVGVQSVGKVIYFTALYPYLMLTILLIIGLSSDGFEHGLEYLFDPDWSKLGDFRVWQAASEQVFFSASIGFGGLIAMSSYVPVKSNILRNAIVIVVINSATSMFAALGIFSIKGHMAKDEYDRCQAGAIEGCDKSLKIRDYVAENDASTGLVFIAMAKALDLVGDGYTPSVLSMMFYLMIISLGLDSLFGSLEGYLAILKDIGVMKKLGYRTTLGLCCGASALFSLLFCSVHGSFFIDIFDKYGCVLVLVFVGLFELIGVAWIYGLQNVSRDFKLMTEFRLPTVLMILLKYIGPASLIVTLVGQFVLEGIDDEFLTYKDRTGELVSYPWWAELISMLLFLSAVIWFPLAILMTCYINRVRKSFDWGPIDFNHAEMVLEVKPSPNSRWEQLLFFLKPYDYPENVENE